MRVRPRLLPLVLVLTAAAPSYGQDRPRAAFFSQDGDVTMALQMNKPAGDLLSSYGQPDKREPFEWRSHKGELWSYVRTMIATNSTERPATLACVRQFYIEPKNLMVHGTWRSGFCYPPYDPKVLDTLTLPGKP